jgi:nucleoside-diphosphate-sugar epimerase
MKMISVFGHRGFIGSHLLRRARDAGCNVRTFERGEIPDGRLGHVLYAIGLTADFRQRPRETAEAHVCYLNRILAQCRFESFCYLSSTRVYARREGTSPVEEHEALYVRPADPSDLYNLSKLMGESLLQAGDREHLTIFRLSNVFGEGMGKDCFLGSLLAEAREHKTVLLRQAPQSGKDYVSVDDVAEILLASISKPVRGVYNLASGRTTTHQDIADVLARHGIDVRFEPGAPVVKYPPISIARLERDFHRPDGLVSSYLDDRLKDI